MATQLLLDGFDNLPGPTDRLFFAIRPDDEAAARIERLVERLRIASGLTNRPITRDRLHITLFWLGDHFGLPQKYVDLLHLAAAQVGTGTVPFDVEFDRVEYFGRRADNKPLVLRAAPAAPGIAALGAFRESLGAAIGFSEAKRRATNFTPHVTLLYDTPPVARQVVHRIGWPVREFFLVHSLLGRSRHEVLGRWTLSDELPAR